MSVRAIEKTKLMLLVLLGMSVIGTLVMWGCGTSGYDSHEAKAVTAYYKRDAVSGISLVEPATVKTWVVDNQGKTDTGKRVIVLDCVPNASGVLTYSDTESWFAGDKARILQNLSDMYGGKTSPQYKSFSGMPDGMFGHIPGAIPNVSHEGYEVAVRNDGPIEADHEVGTGALIDQMLQKYGVTKDDVIVISTSRYDYPGFCPSRLWWTLYYWGFAKENIRVLNGGNKAYAMAGGALQKGVTLPLVTPSSFSVTELPQRHLDTRIAIGELIALVDSGRTSLPDDDAEKVVILDTRQPPVAYYFADQNTDGVPDIFQLAGYTYNTSGTNARLFTRATDSALLTLSEILFKETTPARVAFSGTTNPPVTLPNPYAGITTPAGPSLTGGMPLAIPLGAKGAAFEGIVKGAKVTKSGAWNITVPALLRADGGYKTKAELLPILAAAGIDGTKPIITYCNSGALASIYWYVFHEICEFKDVRMYDGSWQEWALLSAYEPTDNTYVINDDYATFPSYPAASPSVVFFAAPNKYLEWDGAKFTDKYTGADASAHVKAGGALGGIPTWDTVTRSEHVVFRPTRTINDNDNSTIPFKLRIYNGAVDWPTAITYPNYQGPANQIFEQDKAYSGAPAATGGSAPAPFIPKGGGC